MNRSLSRTLGLVGFAALLSQAGHLVVYQIQFGATAATVQSTGAHAYFPGLAKTGLGLVAITLTAGLLMIGAARLVAGRVVAKTGGPQYINLLALLFTVQLACFGLQETIESLAAGVAVPSAPTLIMWGTVGQLPVAIVAAVAIKWLLVRFGGALVALEIASVSVRQAGIAPPVILLPRTLWLEPAVVESCPAAYAKRGPPPALRR